MEIEIGRNSMDDNITKLKQYKVTIGIECHVQLNTNTKLFSGANNDARQATPNTLINHIDFGMPGALPVLNQEALHLASKAAFALNTVPQKFSKFDRKHYFYPDLPMGYQITQYDEPIILGGFVDIIDDQGVVKRVNITRAHLEADAGKSTHPDGDDLKEISLIDLNRAGTPLLEIVSEPEMHSAKEAKAYARELYLRMRYGSVSDCNMYYGNMRFDVNVSISSSAQLGTRTETKNLNSFKSIERAVLYEVKRQTELLDKGQKIVQETRGWDDAKQKTFSQRSKEDADDYRYMPDPDIPPVLLNDKYIDDVRKEMAEMPDIWRQSLNKLGLDRTQIEILLDSDVELPEQGYLALVNKIKNDSEFTLRCINWLINVDIPFVKEHKTGMAIDRLKLYQNISDLITSDQLSSTKAKLLIVNLLTLPELPVDISAYAQNEGYIQNSDLGEIDMIVKEIIDNNPQVINDIRQGETKAIGFLVGQVMKQSQGKANPSLVMQQIKKQIGIS